MKFPVRRAILATTVAFASTALVVGCTSAGEDPTDSDSAESPRGDSLTLGTVLEVNSFDPAQAHFAHHRQFFQPTYDSLLRQEPDGTIVPMLATEWEYNEDSTELTLTIRDDVTFTDGTDLDAEAVKFNLERLKQENGPAASTLGLVSSIEAPADDTVVIELEAPDPGLLYNMSVQASFIGSPTAIEAGGIDTMPVGSGPYVMDASASIPGSEYTFTINEDYWDPSLQHYDEIVLSVIPDATARLNALLAGQIDGALLSPKAQEQALSGGLVDHLYEVNIGGIMLLDRDGTVVEPLADVRVRQAINYAINREEFVAQVEAGLGTTTSQIFPPDSDAFNPEYEDFYAYDPDKARELLAEAGYSDGFDIEIPSVNTDPAYLAAMSQYLGDVGIRVTWNERPASEGASVASSGDYVASLKPNAQGPTWIMANQLITPDAIYNPFRNTDPRIDEALEVIQFGSEEESVAAQQDLNAFITEEAWFAPVYRPAMVYVTNAETDVESQVGQAVPSLYYYTPIG
ncbi:ABC transporter substrate-binding protein [Microbacterium sp. SSW1-59]|uniref:ABC transporter substrate-binding protein n=1 Tax=Microbacterium xanthum TaxID=3079794 RepID=UPI002AD3F4A0|nr:ABC transporter substrate-binding protein [Microbacterium sp. SSW1-59]MDZ8201680.1 ABC transporter substrate-binding protein [Microbacterium sp. SSW1-59]